MRKFWLLVLTLCLTAFIPLTIYAASSPIGYEPPRFDFTSKKELLTGGAKLYVSTTDNIHGEHEFVKEKDSTHVKLLYEGTSKYAAYRIAPKFTNKKMTALYRYVRVMYRTSDTLAATIKLTYSDESYTLAPNTIVSGGEWVLSEPVAIGGEVLDRLVRGQHVFLEYTGIDENCDIAIKELAFFKSSSDAYKYYGDTPADKTTSKSALTINGNGIEKYRIITGSSPANAVTEAANELQNYLKKLTGHTVPISDDSTPESEYEILVGISTRKRSYSYIASLCAEGADYNAFCAEVNGNSLVISSVVPATLAKAVDTLLCTYLYKDIPAVPENITLNSDVRLNGKYSLIYQNDLYEVPENVAIPVTVTEDFEVDDGYFTEDNGGDLWNYTDGKYTVTAKEETVSYIHVYESNVCEVATLNYSCAGENADFGLICRYTANDAYVKAGYDFSRGEWYIEFREGPDFYIIRAASKRSEISPDTDYRLALVTRGRDIMLMINGQCILEARSNHISPGCAGLYAKNVALSVDDTSLTLMSGEGTVLRNVEHTILPDDTYREGGTVIERTDGRLIYQYKNSAAFASVDGGKSWIRTQLFVDSPSYLQVLRLINGDLMQITIKTIDGKQYHVSRTSSNDGKSWTDGGIIAPVDHPEIEGLGSGNMNDKLTQSATTGRLFYTINYYAKSIDGNRYDFCEYFFSDDNGKTWTRSKYASHTLPGNEDNMYFAENKILECDDGTLRMYCSWNNLGNIMYSESKDGGVTWSEIHELEGFISSRSSMQFVRDPYGPTDTTYWMLWLKDELHPGNYLTENRTQLCLAYSTDGKNWEYIGDIWRFECRYSKVPDGVAINHLVDPFIQVTEDYIICGSGISKELADTYHNAQRQHIWSIARDTLPKGKSVE